jgi:NYN domain
MEVQMSNERSVRIFWDNSNIFIPAQTVSARRDGAYAQSRLRVHFENLFRLAHAGRPVDSAVCVGSRSSVPSGIHQRLSSLNMSLEFYERGVGSRREQGVDQCLQVHMLRAATDVSAPGVAVLLTGDGAGYESGTGYHADLERLHRLGWGVEVIAWESACSRALREWVDRVGVFVPLDKYFASVTFVEGGRIALPLSLVHRGIARPLRSAA